MNKLEKAIKGLECSIEHINQFGDCAAKDCPYSKDTIDCHEALMRDALALLKAQEPRVLTLDEVIGYDGAMYMECRPSTATKADVLSTIWLYGRLDNTLYDGIVLVNNRGGNLLFERGSYGRTVRCWTARPTDAQREVIPWEF